MLFWSDTLLEVTYYGDYKINTTVICAGVPEPFEHKVNVVYRIDI